MSKRKKAEWSKKVLDQSGIFSNPIVTGILPASTFYPAEDYHQDYHQNNPEFYCQYRKESGRDELIRKIWG